MSANQYRCRARCWGRGFCDNTWTELGVPGHRDKCALLRAPSVTEKAAPGAVRGGWWNCWEEDRLGQTKLRLHF